ncbi:hypothetical protein MMC25_004190 [Agyrium rufum]|nr:hypothetical protein [Agyrium rufum]
MDPPNNKPSRPSALPASELPWKAAYPADLGGLVTLVVGEKSTKVNIHPKVLSRSQVFKTMLESNYVDHSAGIIELPHLELRLVKPLLCYMYSTEEDSTTSLDPLLSTYAWLTLTAQRPVDWLPPIDILAGLYILGDMYEVDGLFKAIVNLVFNDPSALGRPSFAFTFGIDYLRFARIIFGGIGGSPEDPFRVKFNNYRLELIKVVSGLPPKDLAEFDMMKREGGELVLTYIRALEDYAKRWSHAHHDLVADYCELGGLLEAPHMVRKTQVVTLPNYPLDEKDDWLQTLPAAKKQFRNSAGRLLSDSQAISLQLRLVQCQLNESSTAASVLVGALIDFCLDIPTWISSVDWAGFNEVGGPTWILIILLSLRSLFGTT